MNKYILQNNIDWYKKKLIVVKELRNVINLYESDKLEHRKTEFASSFSVYNYGSVKNKLVFEYTANEDQTFKEIGIYAPDMDVKSGDYPITHIKYFVNDSKYKIYNKDGSLIKEGSIDSQSHTLVHKNASAWSIFKSVIAPITGIGFSAINFITGAAAGLATYVARSFDNNSSALPSFAEYMSFYTHLTDSMNYEVNTDLQNKIERDVFSFFAGLGISEFGAIANSSSWMGKFGDVLSKITMSSKIKNATNIAVKKLFYKIAGLKTTTKLTTQTIQKITNTLRKTYKNISTSTVKKILISFGLFTTKEILKISKEKNSDKSIYMFLNFLSKFKELNKDELKTLMDALNKDSKILKGFENENALLSVKTNNKDGIEMKAGQKIIFEVNFGVEFGANTSGWSLLHANGYWNKGIVNKIKAMGIIGYHPIPFISD